MTSWQVLIKMALIGATIIVLAERGSMAATITVHAPDGEGRVFVDVVGKIVDGDFETFKEKTDQIYPLGASHPKKQVIVTLMGYGGLLGPAMQIGEWVRKRAMSTFVPDDRTCASACALIWVAGWPRTAGDTPQIGFHAAYDEDTGRETGAGNAVMGAYLRDVGFGYKAIYFMTRKGPTNLEWLTPDLAKEVDVAWLMLQPPRAIPIPPQQPGLRPPLEVIAAWSKLMPQPVTTSPERGNETVVFKQASPTPRPPEEVQDPARWPQPVNHGWMIQVGAYPAEQSAKERLSIVQSKASKMLRSAEAFIEAIEKGGANLTLLATQARSEQPARMIKKGVPLVPPSEYDKPFTGALIVNIAKSMADMARTAQPSGVR
jgi:hypothetical protein